MAHLMVSSETVVVDQLQDENAVQNRSIGKHRRVDSSDMELGCGTGQAPDSTKRRALGSITNQIDKGRSSRNSTKSYYKRSSTTKLTKSPSPNSTSQVIIDNFMPVFEHFLSCRSFNLAWETITFLLHITPSYLLQIAVKLN